MRYRPWARVLRRASSACAAHALALALAATAAGARPLQLQLENGIEATVWPPEDILRDLTVRQGGELVLRLDAQTQYRLITSTSDPAIVNRGDGRFHPMSVGAVVEALRAVRLHDSGLRIDVYVLPFPRREVLDSSARDRRILLSPGVLEVSEYAIHFTVTHEVGHLYQYRWMPDEDRPSWTRYSSLRGIEDASIYSHASPHRNRPHEIFAEDFRFLFGGELSTYSGSIENDDLALPSEVEGLEEFLRDLRAGRRAEAPQAALVPAPNPFNPGTEIRVRFEGDPSREHARVQVFDAQGHRVRRLFDGHPMSRTLLLPWDGRRDGGERVSSGVYFARLDYRGSSVSTKLLLVR